MGDEYVGVVVKGSLLSQDILSHFCMISTVETPENHWHLYTVSGTRESIVQLSSILSEPTWYTHFWNQERVIVVFKDRIFEYSILDFEQNKSEMVKYGVSVGIPIEQLDFPLNA